jgi:hypothetical protein
MGYVENMVYQIHSLLKVSAGKVDRKTFYLGDSPPVDLYDFANEIQSALNVRELRHLPLELVKALAFIGDLIKNAGVKKFPLSSFRLNNICTEYVMDLNPIMSITGPLPYDYKTGIRRTIEQMKKMEEI